MRLDRRDFLKACAVVVGGLVAWTRGANRTQGEILSITSAAPDSGINGTIANIVTGQAIAGASVRVSGYPAVGTDAGGSYLISLPPGIYEVEVKAPGFMDMSRIHQEVSSSSFLTVDFAMIPLNPTDEENQIIYDKLISSPESTFQEQLAVPEAPNELSIAPAVTIPATINVIINGRVVTMGLDDYVKGVVPAEMPASWPTEALKAQAVLARSYAVAYTASGNPICTDTNCQAYTSNRYPSTSSAVNATSGQVITYNGNIVSTHYFSSCGGHGTLNSENAIYWQYCTPAGWNYVAYERGKSCWGTHNPGTVGPCGYYGHGVGMCQWGASDRANEGWNYLTILQYYYTNIVLYGAPVPPPAPAPLSPANGDFIYPATSSLTLSWSAIAGATYYVEIQTSNGSWSNNSGWIAGTSWTVGIPGLGLYQWRVRAQNSNGVGNFSSYSYFVNSNTLYKTFMPKVDKNSTGSY